jgi:biopolymer transport protein ExbB/TolQ
MQALRGIREFLVSGGVPMVPLLVIGVVVIALAVRSWRALDAATAEDRRLLEARIDAVLFWGFFAAVVGVLGTLGGLAQMSAVIERFGGAVSGPVLWGGLKVALSNTLVGLSIFAVSLPAWFVLRRRLLRLSPF